MKIEDINLKRFFVKIQKDIAPHLGGQTKTPEQQATRGLTALFLATEAGMKIENASSYVVDEGEDLGIDGLYFNRTTQVLYVVQTKFRINQNKSLDQGEVLKFKRGIERLLSADIEGANELFLRAYSDIEDALTDINTKIKICIVSTSKQELPPNVSGIIEDFCKEQNEVDPTFSFRYYKFNDLYQKAKAFSPDSATDIKIPLQSYGSMTKPHKAYYGAVDGAEIASWVKKYGNKLFDRNVRFTLHNTDVNEGLVRTLEQQPGNFWYYNNGITAIAGDVKATPGDTDPKIVHASSLSIVNGAQTAGMLARAQEEGIDLGKVKIQFRVISLESAAAGFDEEITRANNTQNELSSLDFVSLDPRQDLLRSELASLGYEYVVKRGSETESLYPTIEVRDAAIALACAATDISLSVQAKRYVSGLWSNINSEPYTAIFNDQLTGEQLVRVWQAYRECEAVIRELKSTFSKKEASILSHGDRFIAHCVFELARKDGLDLSKDGVIKRTATRAAKALVSRFPHEAEDHFPPTAFKNQKIQEKLKAAVMIKLSAGSARTIKK